MKKNLLQIVVLIIIVYQITYAQIKCYKATGKDSITYVATDKGLLILKRNSSEELVYHSLISDSNKIYKRALDNDKYLIFGTDNSIDLFSLSNKYLPKYIGSLNISGIISIRPFDNYFAVLRGSIMEGNNEQYIVGSENDSIKVLSNISVPSYSYSGRGVFYPEVVYPYLFSKTSDTSIVMYKYSEDTKEFNLIDTITVITPGYGIIQMYGAKNLLYIREAQQKYPQWYINTKKFEIINDTLDLLSKNSDIASHSFIDEIECSDTLIRFNGWYYYLNGKYLIYTNDYLTTNPNVSGLRIYSIHYNYINDGYTLYYSKKIINDTIYAAQYIYKPTFVKDISEIKSFTLFQNYPNPFNPLTTISFYITKSSEVKLKIFNILGKEINTLVNSKKKPGNYNIQFNAQDLPSGIYFYRLIAGSYSSTKKMVIIK